VGLIGGCILKNAEKSLFITDSHKTLLMTCLCVDTSVREMNFIINLTFPHVFQIEI
jgi:hypothetical protein